ncbi:hypothetical protein [Amycolatopsis keratiniphila]|uniref:Uncharacterized protein n=1 Tax=Amycolatopsis keratiniphila TaxID=129921 RepID=R4SUM6_9PSEU|nr:hypothetical protein [Amycolatopsis keratiniphila]AGM07079.1 hypothetical protein AORI_4495 [Amycolatopsis keratiniphila]
MPAGRHSYVTTRRTSTSSKPGHVSYLGFLLLLVGGGVIIGSAFVIAYLGARLYFGLPLMF